MKKDNLKNRIEMIVTILVALVFVSLIIYGIFIAESERRSQIERLHELERKEFELINCNPCQE